MPDRQPYFPFLLGNGADAVLIDYSGSMHCDSGRLHIEQHESAICAWYKSAHRDRRGPILPIVQSTYTLIAGGGEVFEVGSFNQRFDPKTAVLTTDVEAADFRIRLETFLLDEQVLVERCHVKRVPKDRPQIALNLHSPTTAWSQGVLELPADRRYRFSAHAKNNAITADYDIKGVKGRALLWTDHPAVSAAETRDGKRLILADLKAPLTFTKYLIVLDQTDTADHARDIRKTLARLKSAGPDALLRDHRKRWRGFSSRSALTLPDPRLEYLHELSLYLIRAHQHPRTGLISLGNYPLLWAGGVTNSWDAIFPHKALLAANRLAEAKRLIDGYELARPQARTYARQLDKPGACFPWFMNHRGESLNYADAREYPDIQKFNNGAIVMEVFDLYLHTGDPAVLENYWDLIKNICDFLLAAIVRERGNTACVVEGRGADESIHRKNDTFHVLTTIKSLEALTAAAAVLDRPIDPAYRRVLAKLKRGLKANFRGKTLLPFAGAKTITSQVFTGFLLNLPEGIPAESIEQGLRLCQGQWGLTNPGTYRNLVWPWSEFKAATAL
ncbi:MAG: hypothetical protein GXY33_21360, partial [Phycisphaerae bacterium]|nr:hypothetical protein [Phycisphaerae bacterium]